MSHGLDDETISAIARERRKDCAEAWRPDFVWSQGGRAAVPLVSVGAPVLPELTEQILERGGERRVVYP